jgi:hypothetical protein
LVQSVAYAPGAAPGHLEVTATLDHDVATSLEEASTAARGLAASAPPGWHAVQVLDMAGAQYAVVVEEWPTSTPMP